MQFSSVIKAISVGGFIAASSVSAVYAEADKDTGGGHDYRTFHADGKVEVGKIDDSYNADLVMYLAGNQFMVMEDLMKDFQKKNPDIKSVYIETIPPGQILKNQILKQGEVNGKKTNQNPDIFASVNQDHLKKLKKEGKLNQYMIYTHNKLELMIKQGNPKNIKSVKDLGRDDLVQSHPNPLTEGIFKFYGSEMLNDLGLLSKVTGDQKCKSCWAVPNKTWFTQRHHRETPARIESGEADVGIVWTTEVAYAKAQGRKVDGVAIEAPFNKQDKVGYAIGALSQGKNSKNAERFLSYLTTADAQAIYEKFGFGRASADDLKMR